jgi:hypothetical protein
MRAVPSWQPSTAYLVSHVVAHGGNVYVCGAAGTSASTGGPTGTAGTFVTDGTAKWYYFAANTITVDPTTSQPNWVASTAYTLGQRVTNGASIFTCTVAGTSASSGGPTGTSNAITDNTVTWSYYGAALTNPYAADFPTYSYATSAPGTATNIYYPGGNSGKIVGQFNATGVYSIATAGSGYVVGDQVTIAGGVFTAATVWQVTAVTSGAVTALQLLTAGSYSSLPTTAPHTQASTTGSGTGLTVTSHFTQPIWCRIRGADPVKNQTGSWLMPQAGQMVPLSNEQWQSTGVEFMTDAPSVTFQLLTSAVLFNGVVIVDGVRYNLAPLDAPVAASNANYYTLTFPSGRRVRRWKIEARTANGAAFYIPPISVDSNSTVWAPTDDAIKAVFIGDSLTAGATPGPFVPGNCVPFGVGHELGWGDCWDYSRGSTGYVHVNSGGDAFPYRVAQAAALKPDVFVFMGSWNDLGTANATISAAVQSCITTIRNSGSIAPIIFFGIWSANASNVGAAEGAVQAGIIDPLNRSFWIPIYGDPVAPWVLGTWNNNPTPAGFNMSTATNANLYVDSANSPHPSDAGTQFEWQRMADAIRKKVIPALTM